MVSKKPKLSKVSRVAWHRCMRITAMHSSPGQVFQHVADPGDLRAVTAVMDAGAGASWATLPFLTTFRHPGRFSDSTFGAYYAARDLSTALAERRFHTTRLLTATQEPPQLIGVGVLEASFDTQLADIRGQRTTQRALYNPDPAHYGASQRWARAQRASGAKGIVYDSVRHPAGTCVALFYSHLIRNCHPTTQIAFEWNGTEITSTYELTTLNQ